MIIGYIDQENQYTSSNVKFAVAIGSIIPVSYYIGMGIARWDDLRNDQNFLFTSTVQNKKKNLEISFPGLFWSWCLLSIVSAPCSVSAQSNFAVGAVVNATFGSITELTFYIIALVRGHQKSNPCLQEVVKATLTGTLLGCILFIPVRRTPSTRFFLTLFGELL